MNQFFEAHSLWWDSLFSLDAEKRGLDLIELGMPRFCCLPWEASPPLRNGCVVGCREVGVGEGEEGRAGASMQNLKINKEKLGTNLNSLT